MKTVAFYQPFMNERGTCVAMINYAHYNQTLLGNKSFFIYDSKDRRNEQKGLNLIRENFDIYDINYSDYNSGNPQDRSAALDKVLEEHNATHIYICKSGHNDGVIPSKAKVLIQVVGMVDPSEAHGDVWAYVSNFTSNACSNGTMPVVPYMVDLPKVDGDFRQELNISKESIVIGRYGGMDTFDIPWAMNAVISAVNNRPELVFVFLNTPKFAEHPRIIFLESIVHPVEKVKYLNTCDAILHARWVGEAFGMVCAEASCANKPVMTMLNCPERHHIETLGDKGLYYTDVQSLYDLLMTFVPNTNIDWNCYREYTPEKVMKIFDSVYLKD